jgi:very-short-patch-repair endonuclease
MVQSEFGASRSGAQVRRARARALRKNATDAEQELWWHLRRRLPLYRSHFRRQVPIGVYVADFACFNPRIVIEVDGSQHADDAAVRRDLARTAALEAQGFHVVRFWNHEIFNDMEVVLDTIHAAMNRATPTPYPSPQGGGAACEVAQTVRRS